MTGSEDSSIRRAIDAFARGQMIVVADDGGEGMGFLACAAHAADADAVNDMATHARGLVCLGVTEATARRLGLSRQAQYASGPAYTISIEAATGVTTGISTADRARTIEVAVDPQSGPADVVSPGHLFPVVSHAAGVLAIRGPAEAVVDLARLAGCAHEAGAYCQALGDSGDEARPDELRALAKELNAPFLTYGELVRYRTAAERLVEREDSGELPTAWGAFEVSVWRDLLDGTRHVLLSLGACEVSEGQDAPLVRVHSQCLTGDVFHSQRCDCGAQLSQALEAIREAGVGALLYLRQEGRGIGLVGKLQAYELQDRGRDTVEANRELGYEADLREYGVGAQILARAGYQRVRLLTNNPRKIAGLEAAGIAVEERLPIVTPPNPANERYLQAKQQKLGHLLGDLP